MKPFVGIFTLLSLVFLTACGASSAPMTKQEMADKYGMTEQELDEMSDAAARMNMTLEEHMEMMGEE